MRRFGSSVTLTVGVALALASSPARAFQEPAPEQPPAEDEAPLPIPAWKWVLFGTSAGLFAASLGVALGLGIPVRQVPGRRGPLWNDIEATALDSLTNEVGGEPFTFDDVDPERVRDVCSSDPGSGGAREVIGMTAAGNPGIRNAAVAEQCARVDTWKRGAIGAGVFAGFFFATTVATTTLLFVDTPRSRLARRGFGLGAAPMLAGRGAYFAVSARF